MNISLLRFLTFLLNTKRIVLFLENFMMRWMDFIISESIKKMKMM